MTSIDVRVQSRVGSWVCDRRDMIRNVDIQNIERLRSAVTEAGHDCRSVELTGAARLLVMQSGARALGLFPDEDGDNFFWTHPAWISPAGGRSIYDVPGWPNPGGDRTWISPEVELFISNLKDIPGTHRVPVELDPGNYRWTHDGSAGLTMHADLHLLHTNQRLSVELTKSFSPVPDPLQHDDDLVQSVQHAGYQQQTTLQILPATERSDARIDIWNLTQLFHGGVAIIPTIRDTNPVVMFGKVDPADLDVNTARVLFSTRQSGVSKIGFEPSATPGRAGYLYSRDRNSWNLVVRDFVIDLSQRYVDAPWWLRDERGTCVQVCSYSVDNVSFSELEYHTPAIGHGTQSSYLDTSQIWAYRGEREVILRIAQRLLGTNPADHALKM
jgi:uncharacterized protein DUF6786